MSSVALSTGEVDRSRGEVSDAQSGVGPALGTRRLMGDGPSAWTITTRDGVIER